jgi:hypothetical protein
MIVLGMALPVKNGETFPDLSDLRPIQIYLERWPKNEREFTQLVNALRTEFDVQVALNQREDYRNSKSYLAPSRILEFHGLYYSGQ